MSILQILEKISSDSARSHKIAVLNEHKTDSVFLDVIYHALNPRINYYVKKIPEYNPTGKNTLRWGIGELSKLSSREVTGHAAIAHLTHILNNLSSDDAVVMERIIKNDLRCGVAESTINSVINGFIPTYPVLLAKAYSEKAVKAIKFPAYIQTKEDGMRVNFHVKNGTVFICSRTGREIDISNVLDSAFLELAKQYKDPVIFDGELVVLDAKGNVLPRKTGNGIINKNGKGGNLTKSEADNIRAKLWDAIPYDEFFSGKSKEDYKHRFEKLQEAAKHVSTGKFSIVESKIVNSLDEAFEYFDEMIARKLEGAMLKNFSGIWSDTRSSDIVKFKAELEADLEVLGSNPGKGKFEGMVGSIYMGSSDFVPGTNNRRVEVNISGMSDDLRKEITDNFESEWMGKICAVMYNERISSKDKRRAGIDSLFLPRLIEKREDKTVADASKDIK